MNENLKLICNGTLVLPNKVIQSNLLIDKSRIIKIENDSIKHENVEIIDAQGMYILPGLIDIHCDAIEKEVQPRPNTIFPMDLALYELEKKLAGNGITTIFHSLSLGTGLSLRGDNLLIKLINEIVSYREKRTMINHRIHLRYEISHLNGLKLAKKLLKSGVVEYLSFMNHAPGQGQYKRQGAFESYVMKNQGVNQEEVKKIVDNILKLQQEIKLQDLINLAHQSRKLGVPIASHDDDSISKINDSLLLGTTVSEFPLNLATASYAKERNLFVCVGAPNIVRGKSHDKNMRAIDAIKRERADIICSDYHPSSLLPAVFKLIKLGIDFSKAVNMVSLNPAKAMDIDKNVGSIEVGKSADLLFVKIIDEYPFVHKTMVSGKEVYLANFR